MENDFYGQEIKITPEIALKTKEHLYNTASEDDKKLYELQEKILIYMNEVLKEKHEEIPRVSDCCSHWMSLIHQGSPQKDKDFFNKWADEYTKDCDKYCSLKKLRY
jgi:uncharacterized protein YutE (UPF0331/DUF86 family)